GIQRSRTFNFGDDEGIVAQRSGCFAHCLDVGSPFHEGLAYRVHTIFKGICQAVVIVPGEGADAEINAWKIETFPRAQLSTDNNTTMDIISCDAAYFEVNEAVIQEERVTGLDGMRKAVEGS